MQGRRTMGLGCVDVRIRKSGATQRRTAVAEGSSTPVAWRNASNHVPAGQRHCMDVCAGLAIRLFFVGFVASWCIPLSSKKWEMQRGHEKTG